MDFQIRTYYKKAELLGNVKKKDNAPTEKGESVNKKIKKKEEISEKETDIDSSKLDADFFELLSKK